MQWRTAVYLPNWSLAEGKVPYTAEELRGAELEALELIGMLDARTTQRGIPLDIRSRAFTLWARDYRAVAALGTWLRTLDPSLGGAFAGIGNVPTQSKPAPPKTPTPTPEPVADPPVPLAEA